MTAWDLKVLAWLVAAAAIVTAVVSWSDILSPLTN